mmetsp:Transcript_49804/g.132830  ORF Transcript_49804/g.132830 Transcript_49804/m.132830 type:complete len:473 (+) Transcript_49804:71-1489(+)
MGVAGGVVGAGGSPVFPRLLRVLGGLRRVLLRGGPPEHRRPARRGLGHLHAAVPGHGRRRPGGEAMEPGPDVAGAADRGHLPAGDGPRGGRRGGPLRLRGRQQGPVLAPLGQPDGLRGARRWVRGYRHPEPAAGAAVLRHQLRRVPGGRPRGQGPLSFVHGAGPGGGGAWRQHRLEQLPGPDDAVHHVPLRRGRRGSGARHDDHPGAHRRDAEGAHAHELRRRVPRTPRPPRGRPRALLSPAGVPPLRRHPGGAVRRPRHARGGQQTLELVPLGVRLQQRRRQRGDAPVRHDLPGLLGRREQLGPPVPGDVRRPPQGGVRRPPQPRRLLEGRALRAAVFGGQRPLLRARRLLLRAVRGRGARQRLQGLGLVQQPGVLRQLLEELVDRLAVGRGGGHRRRARSRGICAPRALCPSPRALFLRGRPSLPPSFLLPPAGPRVCGALRQPGRRGRSALCRAAAEKACSSACGRTEV